MYRPYPSSQPDSRPFLDVESQLRNLSQDFAMAFNTGNYDQAAGLFASDGVLMAPYHEGAHGQKAVERTRPPLLANAQPVAQPLVPLGPGEEPVHQRPQIEARAAAHDRQSAASGDLRRRIPPRARELARREQSVGFQNVDQVMRNPPPLVRAEFGGADIEMAVHLE